MLIVQPLNIRQQAEADPVIAIDSHGSGVGQTVVINSDGRRVREIIADPKSPVRWFVSGIVD